MSTIETRTTIKLPTGYILKEEEYGVPFKTFSWTEWEDMHMLVYRLFPRFQRAIEQGQIETALLVALEMDEIVRTWLAEVCEQSMCTSR